MKTVIVLSIISILLVCFNIYSLHKCRGNQIQPVYGLVAI